MRVSGADGIVAPMKKSLSIAIWQSNPVVGDLAGNAADLIAALHQARQLGANLLLTPELAVCGYPPEDLLLRNDFYQQCDQQLEQIAAHTQGITLVVGHPYQQGEQYFNAASVIRDGAVVARYFKHALPNDGVFDEKRYFDAGSQACVVDIDGLRYGILICEDLWNAQPAALAKAAGAEILLCLNASPYHQGKHATRVAVAKQRVAEVGLPLVYCNQVGGQDELVFDGASFVMHAAGEVCQQLPLFESMLALATLVDGTWQPAAIAPALPLEAEVYGALVLGVRDYIEKNRFPGVVIGLSGGIDSALTLCIAVDALGPERVCAVMMASPYTQQMSLDDSRALVANLGVQYDEIPIEAAMHTFASLLAPHFAGRPADTTEENLQSRIRGVLLMALSNKTGALVLTTGNKSEMATGYATLYGDMAGGFAVLKDVYKTLVFRLSRWRNTLSPVMPENIITRPPSAELKPDQVDQDSLPPYDLLDAIIAAYVEENLSPAEMIARGLPEAEVLRTVAMIKRNEYKRRQAPIGPRVTSRGFGKDWRYPITSRYRDLQK